MIIKKIKSLDFLLTPILMTLFPIFSFYLKNIAELSSKFLAKPLIYFLSVFLFVTLFLFILIKNKIKASLVVTIFVLIFFSYGHLSMFLNDKIFIQISKNTVLGPDKILLPLIFLFYLFLTFKILKVKSDKNLTNIINFLNFSLIFIVCYLAISILKVESSRKEIFPTWFKKERYKYLKMQEKESPDIYYIVLDGYARQDILKNIYGYDNSWFIESLKKIGFYVADKARCNYIHTYLSLPSTLNMRYLDDLPKKYGVNPTDGSAARKLISDNEVTRKLKNYGYTIVNFATIWEGTGEDFLSDITYKDEGYFQILGKNITLDETTITFLQTTLFSPLIKEVWGDVLRARTLSTLQKLPTVPFLEEKKFVLAHIIAPHPPYVFTADGSRVPEAEFEFADEGIDKRQKYLDQLIFISKQIIPVLQKIIQNSKNPPIIILQADHGPSSIFGKREEWLKNYSEEGVKERSSILYAVFLPNKDYSQFYDSITPVNTFRIIFNKFFGENYELLPDKTYYTSYEKIYFFKDVTDIK